MSGSHHNRLVAVVGATASGKSDAAVLLAKNFSGEVINADSRLFYKGMEIGTARPSDETLKSVPHHLVGFLKPDLQFSLSEFLGLARETVSDIQSRGKLPVVAGGTGQYVWGLLEGWKVPEIPPDIELRKKLEEELKEQGVGALYSRLEELAPEVAASTDSKNHRRVVRALERVASGIEQDHRSASDPGYDSLIVGLRVQRSELHRRIVERIHRMLDSGWMEEVKTLVAVGVDFNLPALSAIGYRDLKSVLENEITLDEARERTIHATNRLVRHQNNWFKQSDPRIEWVDVTDGDLSRVVDVVSTRLKT